MDIAAHRANPEVSIDQHVERRVVALGRSLDDRTAIYLDTKFWIILRECATGKRTDASALELLHRLRTLVAEGKVFCPVSDSHLFEFLKQDDMNSRLETAHIVDELSLGVALLDHRMRMGTEVAHFVHSFEGDADDLHPLRHLVWSKLGYVLGFVHPSKTGFDAETELAIQKAFFDRMWTASFEEMFKTLGTSSPPDGLDFDIKGLNQSVMQNAEQIKSFAQAYATELGGVAELGADIAMEIMGDLFHKKTGEQPPERGSQEWHKFRNQWPNLLLVALKKRSQVKQQLRTMHIHASLHAAFRWDKARRFTSNDLYDFEHASAALAHCQAFFTERPLLATITARHVALDELFQCRVVSEVADAIVVLKAIEAGTGGPSGGGA
jgi:hypothetical protein